MLLQWLNRWRKFFQTLEKEDLWVYRDRDDKVALQYIYMPILRMEIVQYRQEYNAYPIRYNHLSRLPFGSPADNYLLDSGRAPFSVPIAPSWTQVAQDEFLTGEFDADAYLSEAAMQMLNRRMEESPLGPMVDLYNARDQYLFLRNSLHTNV
jgi:hypothetical protein